MTEQKEPSCVIKRESDSAEHSVHDEIKKIIAACGAEPPLLAWAEPQADWCGHGTGRHPQFVPLQLLRGGAKPNWPEDLPLVEARLFWSDRALHIVANEYSGCRWASFKEVPKEGTPVQANSICVNREILPVYTLRDLARFGLTHDTNTLPQELCAITYRQQGRLVAWRLTEERGATNA